jgi:hypothetical protein
MKRRNFLQSSTLAGITLLLPFKLPAGERRSILAQPDLFTGAKPFPIHVGLDSEGHTQITVDGGARLYSCRAYLASRIDGVREWEEEYVDYVMDKQTDDLLKLQAVFHHAIATVRFERNLSNRCKVSGRLVSTSSRGIEIARFHYLDGLVSDRSLNLLSMRQFELPGRIVHPEETLPSPKDACEKGWGKVIWPRLQEPVHSKPNTAISGDLGMLAPDWNTPGFFFGFTGPGSAFGEVGIRTAQPVTPFYLAVLLDSVLLKPSGERMLEEAVISFGDPQDELRHWIGMCAEVSGPVRVRPPLVGYCSWYQLYSAVQPSDIRKAISEYASYPIPPGGKTIQIDDGFQVWPGDWSGRGEWKKELPKMPEEMRAAGFIPGIWVAPTAIHSGHPIAKEHPEWLQRDAEGQPCIRFHNWESFGPKESDDKETYFLDPDHPGARTFITSILQALYAQGWRYFKIDFAYTVSDNRVKVDRCKTTFETLRSQWQLFREALGEDALINACIGGTYRYSIGVADIARIGGDIGSNPAQLRRNIAEMMLRTHVNGVWFQADPDVFAMRTERTGLNFELSHLLTATQGLIGSAFLTSDFSRQWDERAKAIVCRYWNEQGPQVPVAMRVFLKQGELPEALAVAYDERRYAIGIYNWSDKTKDVTVSLHDVRIPPIAEYTARLDSYGSERITLNDDKLTVFSQPGESLRIIRLDKK